MTDKITTVLSSILEQFKTGDIPQAIAITRYPIPNIPSSKWSMFNQLVMLFSGTADARGFRQWQTVSRKVKKGSQALHILVPMIKTRVDDNGDDQIFLAGFMTSPVFRMEDTEGEPLAYEKIKLPQLPLMEKAQAWGISVKAVSGSWEYNGYYVPQKKEICLATPEERTFFHELAHAAHEKVLGSIQAGQHPAQEIVAELSAQALCRIVGKTTDSQAGNSYRYIETYSAKIGCTPYIACVKLLSEVEKVLNLILTEATV
ncbi:MAG: antirestriction protein [Ignavibacteria bacterium GWB2_35_12]|nr:MAG: antirestriction protein [Ignavibacteria bacterium GWB2_35_12]OGU87538.1 MAG: antirestriction protein [Ignavibacteria bacterium RIFOXYA2_FULL_35_10]OGV21729.1 MAG: antirestriction protein [Ignavibacteria bacterium RIFOXYC2_FULL_35_21]